MSTAIHADPTPMRADADGVIRIGTTRVTLDTLFAARKRSPSANVSKLDKAFKRSAND